MEFKCPMCRQVSTALLYSPEVSKPAEADEDVLGTITQLIGENKKPCVSLFFFVG